MPSLRGSGFKIARGRNTARHWLHYTHNFKVPSSISTLLVSKFFSMFLVRIMEMESRSADLHHAYVHDPELTSCDNANMNPPCEETLCAQFHETSFLSDAAK